MMGGRFVRYRRLWNSCNIPHGYFYGNWRPKAPSVFTNVTNIRENLPVLSGRLWIFDGAESGAERRGLGR
jgi:hypothetical protein